MRTMRRRVLAIGTLAVTAACGDAPERMGFDPTWVPPPPPLVLYVRDAAMLQPTHGAVAQWRDVCGVDHVVVRTSPPAAEHVVVLSVPRAELEEAFGHVVGAVQWGDDGRYRPDPGFYLAVSDERISEHVLAHEIGHLLHDTRAHWGEGIMRPSDVEDGDQMRVTPSDCTAPQE